VVAILILVAAPLLAFADSAADSDWTAPAGYVGMTNPLAGRSDVVQGGEKIFAQRCATCHGPNARGGERAPDLTSAAVQAQSDGALFWKISSGNAFAGMPTFSFLPAPQRWQIILYLRDATARGGAPPR
jgi:mono/diheme cytochrome c family protein